MKGFARCEYFDCGAAAVVALKLEGMAAFDDGAETEVSLVLHYCGACYEKVIANETKSSAIYTELRDQGVSEKMANHITLARTERE